jgi:septal ring-binding cell division protein DamX
LQERRQYQRLTPSTPQLVLLDESKYSLLFDVGEGGLAIEGFAAQKPRDEFSIEFDLPEGNGCIQAKAQVVWTSDSGYRTGFRFLDLGDAHREQLRTWIADAQTTRISIVEGRLDQPTFAPSSGSAERLAGESQGSRTIQSGTGLFPVPQKSATDDVESEHESRAMLYRAGLALAVVTCALAFFIGYYWRAAHSHARSLARRPAVPTQTAAPAAPSTPPAPVPQPPPPAAPVVSEPGFVLQVAAMASEANADAMAADLHKKNFPAFVFKRDPDRLYRVVVGPFPTRDAATTAEGELKTEDFNPLLKPWSPE